MKMQKLPVGIENFEELRTEDFYYVDKTGLIRELLNGWGKVNLFTRPRRFGKTLNMSMLKSFFEIGGNISIFEGLQISGETELCRDHMGKYPVVFVSLKGVDGLTFPDACSMLRSTVLNEAYRLQFLLTSDRLSTADKELFGHFFDEQWTMADFKNSIQLLTILLEKHYGRKTILLIDEYDVPLDKAYQHGYYEQMIDLLRGMFSSALKTNNGLHFAVLTGCLRVSKESIFTGLNNLTIHSISDTQFDEYFGFTQKEVDQLLRDCGFSDHAEVIRKWYDGYRFGGKDVYCPWDVINYCYDLRGDHEAEPKAYWMGTSSNDMVRTLISQADNGTTQLEIEDLIAGKTVRKALNDHLTHNEILDSIENIWSLLYMTGYLTVSEKPRQNMYTLRIPNLEIRQIFTKQVMEWFQRQTKANAKRLSKLYEAFETGRVTEIEEYLNEQLLNTVSSHDAHESFYHGFLLALLNTCSDWQVVSNAETGRGRSDILAQRKDRKMGFVVEVKEVRDGRKLTDACQTALAQIREKDYTALLRRVQIKEILIYGIAFHEKSCRVMMEKSF